MIFLRIITDYRELAIHGAVFVSASENFPDQEPKARLIVAIIKNCDKVQVKSLLQEMSHLTARVHRQ